MNKIKVIFLVVLPLYVQAQPANCDTTAIYSIINTHIKLLDKECLHDHYLLSAQIQIADYKADTVYFSDICPGMKVWNSHKINSDKANVVADDSIKKERSKTNSYLYYISKPYFNQAKTRCRITTQVYTTHYMGYKTEYFYKKQNGKWYLFNSIRDKRVY